MAIFFRSRNFAAERDIRVGTPWTLSITEPQKWWFADSEAPRRALNRELLYKAWE
jgi:hypothetical protein